jgi:hypothetical protein
LLDSSFPSTQDISPITMADTILPSPPPPAVPQGWESGWSSEYKTW